MPRRMISDVLFDVLGVIIIAAFTIISFLYLNDAIKGWCMTIILAAFLIRTAIDLIKLIKQSHKGTETAVKK